MSHLAQIMILKETTIIQLYYILTTFERIYNARTLLFIVLAVHDDSKYPA